MSRACAVCGSDFHPLISPARFPCRTGQGGGGKGKQTSMFGEHRQHSVRFELVAKMARQAAWECHITVTHPGLCKP
jgi:hypothetical protein